MDYKNLTMALLIVYSACFVKCTENRKKPTVQISILVRNKAHALPYFLSLLEQQDYPKDRIALWIRSDNNVDSTIKILNMWLKSQQNNYHAVDVDLDAYSKGFKTEKGIADWSDERFTHVINLREQALQNAKDNWANFIWMLDADTFLTNPKTLSNLIGKNETVVAPLLRSDGMYSNFWAGMTTDYYYLRTERYGTILYREEIGCFKVPMVHGAVLIDLTKTQSDYLTYKPSNIINYDGPNDDIITFAISANISEVPLYICNDEVYGYIMIPLESDGTFADDLEHLTNLKAEMLARGNDLEVRENLQEFLTYPEESTLGVDHVYLINLMRRPERRRKMHRLFKELGIRAETINAVDGRSLNETSLREWGIKMLPEYSDPYHGRPITAGEIGCFLSHYLIWNKVLEEKYKAVMVLEDDVRFEPFFRQKIFFVLNDLNKLHIDWDLVYLGRKRLIDKEEPRVHDSKYLVHASYSYWTIGYLLSANGARKLTEARPLEKIIPVDEFFPVLADEHPRDDWKAYFPRRNLVMLSTDPLLIYPTHYTGDDGYVSDTENSTIVNKDASDIQQKHAEL